MTVRALVVVCLVALALPATAANLVLPHQGRLLDATDKPLDGAFDVGITLFASETHLTGETPLWTETYAGTQVRSGMYTIDIGVEDGAHKLLPSSIFTGAVVFLQVAINNVALSPRMRFGMMPIAASALVAADLNCVGCVKREALGFTIDTVAAGAINTAALANGAITADKLAPGAITAGALPTGIDGAKLANGSVGNDAIANGLDGAKLAPGSVTNTALASGLDGAKLSTGTVSNGALANGIDGGKLTDGTVSNNALAKGIDGGKLAAGTVAPGALSGPLAASQVTGLSNLSQVCPANQALVGYDVALQPKCMAVSTTPGLLQFIPGLIDFGIQGAAVVVKTVQLTNIGSVAVSGLTFAATNPYAVSGTPCGTTLAAGATCTVTLTMPSPAGGGTHTGWGSVSSSTGSALVGLTGVGYSVPGSVTSPALSCKAIQSALPSATNGLYWLDIDGASPTFSPFQAYCNFTDQGGGWTLVSRMANACLTATRPAAGTLASPAQSGCAKLSDDMINVLRTQSGADGIFWGWHDGTSYQLPAPGRFFKITAGSFNAQDADPALSQQCSCKVAGPWSASYTRPSGDMSGVFNHDSATGWRCTTSGGEGGCDSATTVSGGGLFLYMHTLHQNGTFPSDAHGVAGGTNGWLYVR